MPSPPRRALGMRWMSSGRWLSTTIGVSGSTTSLAGADIDDELECLPVEVDDDQGRRLDRQQRDCLGATLRGSDPVAVAAQVVGQGRSCGVVLVDEGWCKWMLVSSLKFLLVGARPYSDGRRSADAGGRVASLLASAVPCGHGDLPAHAAVRATNGGTPPPRAAGACQRVVSHGLPRCASQGATCVGGELGHPSGEQ